MLLKPDLYFQHISCFFILFNVFPVFDIFDIFALWQYFSYFHVNIFIVNY